MTVLQVNADGIPNTLKSLPNWVCWTGKWQKKKNGKLKLSKLPIDGKNGEPADSTDPLTWIDFSSAICAMPSFNCLGVGLVFTDQNEIAGIDADYCRNPETGEIEGWAWDIIKTADSYTEVSPSGTGVKIFLKTRANRPGKKNKLFGADDDRELEIYTHKRFFCVTGNHLEGTPDDVQSRDAQFEAIWKKYFQEDEPKGKNHSSDSGIYRTWDELNAELRHRIASHPTSRKRADGWIHCKGICHKGTSNSAIAFNPATGAFTCQAGCDTAAILRAFGLPERPNANGQSKNTQDTPPLSAYGVNEEQTTGSPDAEPFHLTDLGNSERLALQHGEVIRYCHAFKRWVCFTGAHWQFDATAEVRRLARETVRRIYSEASQAQEKGFRQAIADHAKRSESKDRIEAMIYLCQSEKGIPALSEEFDRDPWKLNILNGTLDLKNGGLLPHRKQDFITKIAPVKYEPAAHCPLWLAFLNRIMAENQSLITGLRQGVGYSLTGITTEKLLFILLGSGDNGKSTFLSVIQTILGDYALRTPTETLLVKKQASIPNDVARLRGARFVTARESDEGARLAEATIKDLTGGVDIVSARFLHGEWFDFRPECKIWLGTNHKPKITGSDNAIWNRIFLIPFSVSIPKNEQDKGLFDKLLAEASGILNWALIGCEEWKQRGLSMPQEVKAAVESYRAEMDTVANFISDCCVVGENTSARASLLYGAYVKWASPGCEKPWNVMSQTKFGKCLTEKGFSKDKDKNGVYYKGIGLLSGE